jgi:2-dehydropantoate 2-reductase
MTAGPQSQTSVPRIAVVGAGAIGCRLAAHLADAGVPSVLFDGWREHVEALRTDGLQFTHRGATRTFRLESHHLGDPFDGQPFDIVLMCTRSDGTAAALPRVQGLLSPAGCVVSCQNGLNEDAIAEAVGAERTLGCSLVFGARLTAPGHVESLPGDDTLRSGEYAGGTSARLDRLVGLLAACGASTATPDLRGYRWMKLVLNSIGNPLLLLTGQTAAALHAREDARELMIDLGCEVLRAAHADGVRVSPVLGIPMGLWLDASPRARAEVHGALQRHGEALGPRRLSMVADFEARGRTEVDFINGHVLRRAAAQGLAMPLNAAVVREVQALEQGRRAIDPAAIADVARG